MAMGVFFPRSILHGAGWSLLMCCVSGGAFAEGRLMIDAGSCVQIESAVERLDCYDGLSKATEETGSNASERAPVVEPSLVVEEEFGLSTVEDEQAEEFDQMEGVVGQLKKTAPNRYLIGLENGQVWRQMVSQRYALEVGQEVSIRSGRWGNSFRLKAADLKGFIQVERIK